MADFTFESFRFAIRRRCRGLLGARATAQPRRSDPAINRCMYLQFDPAFARRMARMNGLGAWWKQQADDRLTARDQHWTAAMKT